MKGRDYYLKQERSPLIEWGAESDSSVLRLKKTDKLAVRSGRKLSDINRSYTAKKRTMRLRLLLLKA
jgi:hypothetical protein